MKQQIMKLEFEKNTSIQFILEELIYYKKAGITAMCEINGRILNNENEEELQKELEKIKNKYNKRNDTTTTQNKELERNCKLICQKYQYPKIVRYWIEKAKTVINLDKHYEWDVFCYETIMNYFKILKEEQAQEQEKLKIFLFKTIIYTSLILIY